MLFVGVAFQTMTSLMGGASGGNECRTATFGKVQEICLASTFRIRTLGQVMQRITCWQKQTLLGDQFIW